ncbi:MAG: hypothetical protein M1819_006180 [Sarea resinae]|nr:MAG: hypothetical protein M1819_006180 [Sarea resinae]
MLSRQELLSWLNDLLQLNVTKVEQCGSGAALCQVFDSIYRNVPMHRVKWDQNTEYAFLNNFKVLQNIFVKNKIQYPLDAQSLVKCKMQDNLALLQWTKKYWEQNYPGTDYDPVARRNGAAPASTAAPTGRPAASSGAAKRGVTPTTAGATRTRTPQSSAATSALRQENETLRETVAGLERERDFYFSKLRDIELLIQQAVEADPEIEKDEDGLIKQIQAILYSTEEGFEIPAEAEAQDDLETF